MQLCSPLLSTPCKSTYKHLFFHVVPSFSSSVLEPSSLKLVIIATHFTVFQRTPMSSLIFKFHTYWPPEIITVWSSSQHSNKMIVVFFKTEVRPVLNICTRFLANSCDELYQISLKSRWAVILLSTFWSIKVLDWERVLMRRQWNCSWSSVSQVLSWHSTRQAMQQTTCSDHWAHTQTA